MKPLTSEHTTYAMRIMVWAYPLLTTSYGLNYVLTPRSELRETSTALQTLDGIIPLPLSGAILLVVSASLWLAMTLGAIGHCKSREVYISGLTLLTGFLGVLTVIYFGAGWFQSGGSRTAFVSPLFQATACLASITTLNYEEKQL